jgi:hypothetical protein
MTAGSLPSGTLRTVALARRDAVLTNFRQRDPVRRWVPCRLMKSQGRCTGVRWSAGLDVEQAKTSRSRGFTREVRLTAGLGPGHPHKRSGGGRNDDQDPIYNMRYH